MPKYRTKIDVPWKEILDLHRWYINRTFHSCQPDYFKKFPSPSPSQLELLEEQINGYTALRSFLGYTKTTALERDVALFIQKYRHPENK